MFALTISIQELINILKIMVKQEKKFPKFLFGNIAHDGTGIIFNIPRKEEEDIPMDVMLDFHEQTFEVSLDPDREQPLAVASVTVEEAFRILFHNDRKIREALGEVQYNNKKKYFQMDFTMEGKEEANSGDSTEDGMEDDADEKSPMYEEPFRLLAKVIPLRGNKMRLRIASK